MTANSIFDDEFNRLVKLGMSKSFQLIRKDRRGVAIQKGSKQHKICFRDEMGPQVRAKEPFAPRTGNDTNKLAQKTLSPEMSNTIQSVPIKVDFEPNNEVNGESPL